MDSSQPSSIINDRANRDLGTEKKADMINSFVACDWIMVFLHSANDLEQGVKNHCSGMSPPPHSHHLLII